MGFVVFAAIGLVGQYVVAIALQHLAHGVPAGSVFADGHAGADFGLRLHGPLLCVSLSLESFRLGRVSLNTNLSLVAHVAVLVFAFTDGSHVVFCVRSAKCDGTKTGWREMALLCGAAKLCRLL